MALFIGLISGTSMDAVDAALVDLDGGATIVATHSASIPGDLKRELHALSQDPHAAALRFWNADARVGSVFAGAALALLDAAGVDARDVAAIGSHGQTVYHAPDAATPLTVQLGDPNVIAERTGITTVADFRRRDVAAGGEGAPLAPAFHRAVFSAPGVERGILNLGGIANLTVLPADPAHPLLGFDTGPGNTLLDAFVRDRCGAAMDRDAALAREGEVIPSLLAALLADPYFERAPPKSTGRELFNTAWLDARLAAHVQTRATPAPEPAPTLAPRLDTRLDAQVRADAPPEPPPAPAPRLDAHLAAGSEAGPRDVLRTLCELTVETAVAAVERFAPRTEEIYLCGGGAHNPLITARLAQRAAPIRVDTTSGLGIHPDWVEAAAFAWLAMRTLAGEAGNAPSVTGAAGEAVLGGIHTA